MQGWTVRALCSERSRTQRRGSGILAGVNLVAGDRERAANSGLRSRQGRIHESPVWAAQSAG